MEKGTPKANETKKINQSIEMIFEEIIGMNEKIDAIFEEISLFEKRIDPILQGKVKEIDSEACVAKAKEKESCEDLDSSVLKVLHHMRVDRIDSIHNRLTAIRYFLSDLQSRVQL